MKPDNKYIKAIENCITQNAPNVREAQLRSLAGYIGTGHRMLGLGTAIQKQLAREKYNLDLDLHKDFTVFDTFFKRSPVFELKSTGLNVLDHHYKNMDVRHLYTLLPSWVDHVDNWAHSDGLSKYYTRFLEEDGLKDDFLELLRQWNRDKNPWKRRQSLVSLLYYARTKKKYLPFKTIIGFVEPLLGDEDYYVQKGLGWCLRECYQVYKEQTYRFADKNFDKISATAFSAACEKMSVKEKEALKKKRKEQRLKK